MWITHHPVTGEEMKIEDITHLFLFFPQFREDFHVLFSEGIIRRIDYDRYEWTKTETSLAEYFKWIGKDAFDVPGGFWDPIATVFRMNKGSLSKLASRLEAENARLKNPKESRDFRKIKEVVLRYRDILNNIKSNINEADGDDMEKIRTALKELKLF